MTGGLRVTVRRSVDAAALGETLWMVSLWQGDHLVSRTTCRQQTTAEALGRAWQRENNCALQVEDARKGTVHGRGR